MTSWSALAAEPAADNDVIAEIIVTAQKRATALQDVLGEHQQTITKLTGELFAPIDGEYRAVRWLGAILLVLRRQQLERVRTLVAAVENACAAAHTNPPELPPVLLVVVDEDRHVGTCARVLDPAKRARSLRLLVDRRVERVALDYEHDRDEMRPPVGIRCRQPCDTRRG